MRTNMLYQLEGGYNVMLVGGALGLYVLLLMLLLRF